jgi:hypothetical protein
LCGLGEWRESTTGLSPLPLKLVPTNVPNEKTTTLYATGAWLDDQTFSMIWRFIETAHYERVTCTFQGDSVQVEFKKSLAILNPDTKDTRPILQGQLSA